MMRDPVAYLYCMPIVVLQLLESNFSLCLKYAILFIHILVKKGGFVSTRFGSALLISSVLFLLKCSIN